MWTARAFAFSAKQKSGARNRREVTLFEDLAVMQFVPSHNERQRAHRYFLLIGHTAPRPGVFLQRLEQCDARCPHYSELFCQSGERAFREVPAPHVVVLLESGERRLVSTRNPQSTVRENTLTIAHVTEHFLHRPLVRGVTEITVALAARGKKLRHLQSLRFEDAQNIVAFDFRNISFVIGCVLARFGPGGYGSFRFHLHSIAPLPSRNSTYLPATKLPHKKPAAHYDVGACGAPICSCTARRNSCGCAIITNGSGV